MRSLICWHCFSWHKSRRQTKSIYFLIPGGFAPRPPFSRPSASIMSAFGLHNVGLRPPRRSSPNGSQGPQRAPPNGSQGPNIHILRPGLGPPAPTPPCRGRARALWLLWVLWPKPCLSIWILGAYGTHLGSLFWILFGAHLGSHLGPFWVHITPHHTSQSQSHHITKRVMSHISRC